MLTATPRCQITVEVKHDFFVCGDRCEVLMFNLLKGVWKLSTIIKVGVGALGGFYKFSLLKNKFKKSEILI